MSGNAPIFKSANAAALFKRIGDAAFGFMLPVLAGFIAMVIGDRPALAVGFVGGMMASNGTSGFLGALVAGFATGYKIILMKKERHLLPIHLTTQSVLCPEG